MGRPRLHHEGDTCTECGVNPVAKSGYDRSGEARWKSTCSACHKAKYGRPWLRFRGEECESCGHRPLFMRALSVHHRDGDNTNNDPDNLSTLCHNCHHDLEGLIYQQDGDWESAEGLFERIINSSLNPFKRDDDN